MTRRSSWVIPAAVVGGGVYAAVTGARAIPTPQKSALGGEDTFRSTRIDPYHEAFPAATTAHRLRENLASRRAAAAAPGPRRAPRGAAPRNPLARAGNWCRKDEVPPARRQATWRPHGRP